MSKLEKMRQGFRQVLLDLGYNSDDAGFLSGVAVSEVVETENDLVDNTPSAVYGFDNLIRETD
jgi:hypothetical protein